MKRLATKIIIKVGKRLSEQSKKLNKLDAWNDCMIDLIFAAKVIFPEISNTKRIRKIYK